MLFALNEHTDSIFLHCSFFFLAFNFGYFATKLFLGSASFQLRKAMILETGPSAVTFLCYFSLFCFYCFTLLSFLVFVLFLGWGGAVLSMYSVIHGLCWNSKGT